MNGWFTVEKIYSDTFVISEYRHWEETHCYLLLGTEYAALIDTGLGVANIRSVVEELTDLPTVVLTTHVHWDHIGGHRLFEDFAVHEKELDWIDGAFPVPAEAVRQNLCRYSCDFPSDFYPENYRVFQGTPSRVLHDGELIQLGKRALKVLHTPGHSPGHCCFYEEERSALYTGDLVYKGCLDAFYPSTDPIAFMRSLEKAKALLPKKIWPGHHQLDIPNMTLADAADAFAELYRQNGLRQGSGIFDFGEISVHI